MIWPQIPWNLHPLSLAGPSRAGSAAEQLGGVAGSVRLLLLSEAGYTTWRSLWSRVYYMDLYGISYG